MVLGGKKGEVVVIVVIVRPGLLKPFHYEVALIMLRSETVASRSCEAALNSGGPLTPTVTHQTAAADCCQLPNLWVWK